MRYNKVKKIKDFVNRKNRGQQTSIARKVLLFVALFNLFNLIKGEVIMHILQTIEHLLDTVQETVKQFQLTHEDYKEALQTASDRVTYNRIYDEYEKKYIEAMKGFKEVQNSVNRLSQSTSMMKGYTKVEAIKLVKKIRKIIKNQLSYHKMERCMREEWILWQQSVQQFKSKIN